MPVRSGNNRKNLYMIHYNKFKKFQQEKKWKQLCDDVETKYQDLVKRKKALGFGEIDIGEFLTLSPAADASTEKMSSCIKLQEDFKAFDEGIKPLIVEDLVVEELNKTHAVIHTDKINIATEKPNPIYGEPLAKV